VTKVVIKAADGTGAVESYHNANKKLETTSAGVTVTGNIAVTGTVDGRDVAADGTKLDGIASSATSVGGATGVDFNDNVKARFGTGNDLEVYHDASHSYISDVGTGDLKITSNGGQVVFQKGSSETLAAFATDNSCELYYDNSLKFTTLSDGAKTYGRHVIDGDLFLDNGSHAGKDIYWDASEKFMRWEDGVEAKFGGGGDLRIYHNGTDAYINNQGDGHVFIRGDDVKIQDANAGHDMGVFIEDGAVELYYDNAKKLETTSWGVDCQGNTRTSGDFVCVDSGKFRAGNSSDLQIYHDGTHSYITNATNALKIKGDLIRLNSSTGDEMMLAAHLDGAVELYYDNAKKLETKSDGVAITGNTYFDPATSASTTGSYFQSASAGRAILHIGGTSTASSSNKVIFANPNGTVGSITTDANATNFNTSSDYRLKENTVSISDGITRLKTLKPYRFNFKSDPTTTVDGFFAHEVTAVPEAVAGEKDGTEMQGMDYGRITPLLTAALQEAITKIETLETKVAALEAG
jgi:hypothetical protein